jgi:hypothetical protein
MDHEELHAIWAVSHGLDPIETVAFDKKLSAKAKRRMKMAAVAAGASAATYALNPEVTRTANRTGVRVGRGGVGAAINRRPERPAKKGKLKGGVVPARTTIRVDLPGGRGKWATRFDGVDGNAATWRTSSRRSKRPRSQEET